ncbi:MAG: hypothetical protein JNN20_11880 [Betaproteobacteria bacterium]|nr:hypothetical protein [Betaproteobacteria bacterium]
MKTLIGLLAMMVVLCACGDKSAPKAEVKVESASEALKNDDKAIAARLAEQKAGLEEASQRDREATERRQFADALGAIGKQWRDVLAEATRTGRGEIAGPIKKMEALKASLDSAAVNNCTTKARATLSSSMSSTIDAFKQFGTETGAGTSDAAQQKLAEALEQLTKFDSELGSCV